jgi:hypothetical protein
VIAGTYHWLAAYSGDANDLPTTGMCDASIVTPGVVPAAPVVSAEPGDGLAIVLWSAPTSSTPITQYAVSLSLNGVTLATANPDPTRTSITFNGLTNAHTYRASVAAVNAAGTGDPGFVDVIPESTPAGGPGGGADGPPTPGATPELDSLLLFGSGTLSLVGYALTRRRARRAR